MISILLAVVGGIAAIICLIAAIVLSVKYIQKILGARKKSVFAKSNIAMKALEEIEKDAVDLNLDDLNKISEMKKTTSTSQSISLVHENDGVYFKGFEQEDKKDIENIYRRYDGIIIGN